jgi:hypothetical protein
LSCTEGSSVVNVSEIRRWKGKRTHLICPRGWCGSYELRPWWKMAVSREKFLVWFAKRNAPE